MLLSTSGCGILQLLRYIMVLRSVVLSIYIHLLLQTHQLWPVVGRVMSTLDFIIRVMSTFDVIGRGPNNCSMILDAFRMAEWAHLFKSYLLIILMKFTFDRLSQYRDIYRFGIWIVKVQVLCLMSPLKYRSTSTLYPDHISLFARYLEQFVLLSKPLNLD